MNEGVQGESAGPTVFLSYARPDQEQAARLAKALEARGFDVWWDTLIEGGAAFAESIESALDSSDAVIVAWSRASVGSDWVRDEAAKGRDQRKLIPVSLDGAEPPLGFRQYQSINLSRWQGDPASAEISALARSIHAAAGAAGRPARPAMEPRIGMVGVSRRRLLIAAGATVAGAAGWWAWRAGLLGGRAPTTANSVAVLPFVNLSRRLEPGLFLRWALGGAACDAGAQSQPAGHGAGLVREIPRPQGRCDDHRGQAWRRLPAGRKRPPLRERPSHHRRPHRGATGFSRWSQTFDRVMEDIFAIQSEIADTVAHELVMRVSPMTGRTMVPAPPARRVVAAGSTRSVAAYDAYLRGRAQYDLSADETSERAALAQFDAAIAADPGYAAAHAARARSLTAIANQYGEVIELPALYDAAVAAAHRAIDLAPDYAEAYSTLGFTLFQGRLDARGAREPFERSRELGSGEATVMARFAQYSARVGRKTAATMPSTQALRLDPLNPLIHRAAGAIEYAARNYVASISHARRALEMNPRMSRAHAAIGDALLMLGRNEEAHTEFAAEPVEDFRLAGEAIVQRKLGNLAAAAGGPD